MLKKIDQSKILTVKNYLITTNA